MSLIDAKAGADVGLIALALDREARGEPSLCRLAIAFSIMDRVHNPSWWGTSVVTVLGRKWQYSSFTAPGDANLVEWPNDVDPMKKPIWEDCLIQAQSAYMGAVPNPVGHADSYYAITIPRPKWADDKKFVVQIGKTRFYDIQEDYEHPVISAKVTP